MKVSTTPLPDVILLEIAQYGDARGRFAEMWNRKRYEGAGIRCEFVQDNYSFSNRGVLRGLHYQNPFPQAKLVQVLQGSVFDVVVDLRKGSQTFGKWWGTELSDSQPKQIFIPVGFAHGFLVTSDETLFCYKSSDFYHKDSEHILRWNDPDVGIAWPVKDPILSPKDAAGQTLAELLKNPASLAFNV